MRIQINTNPRLIKAQKDYDETYAQAVKIANRFALLKDKTSQQAHSLANRHNALAAKLKAKEAYIESLKPVL